MYCLFRLSILLYLLCCSEVFSALVANDNILLCMLHVQALSIPVDVAVCMYKAVRMFEAKYIRN